MAIARGAAYTLRVPFATGLTITATVSKDGGAFAAATNACAEIGTTGVYSLTLTAAEMTASVVDVNLAPSTGTAKLATISTDPQTVALTTAYDAAKTAASQTSVNGIVNVCTEARLAELDAANLPADVDTIKSQTTAASIRDAAGLANANLDTQLGGILGAIPSSDVPPGYTRYIIVAGTLLPGTVIDAYLPTDTDYSDPQVDNSVIASNGGGYIDLPTGGAFTLVGRLTGKTDTILTGVIT